MTSTPGFDRGFSIGTYRTYFLARHARNLRFTGIPATVSTNVANFRFVANADVEKVVIAMGKSEVSGSSNNGLSGSQAVLGLLCSAFMIAAPMLFRLAPLEPGEQVPAIATSALFPVTGVLVALVVGVTWMRGRKSAKGAK